MLVGLPLLPNPKFLHANINVPIIHIPSPFWDLISIVFLPSSFPSILGPYIPKPSPSSLPSILGPYIHPFTISNSSTLSPHIPIKNQQRHTSLNSFQCSPSISSPYHLSSYTHTMANGRKLDAKDKVNQAKYPQKYKDQHVPSKRHVQEKKNVIKRKEEIRRPQRLKIKNSKIMDSKAT